MIQKCKNGCQHEFQDKKYGVGMRVHTTSKTGEPRCTVCGPKPSWQQKLRAHAATWKPVHGK